MPETRKRRTGIAPAVYSVMRKNANIAMSVTDVSAELGIENAPIIQALSRMTQIPEYHVDRLQKAVYIFRTVPAVTPDAPIVGHVSPAVTNVTTLEKPKTRKMYESVGNITDEYSLIRDENDGLFVAIPLATYMNAPLSQR